MTKYSTAKNKPTTAMCNSLDESYNVEQKKPANMYCINTCLHKAPKQRKLTIVFRDPYLRSETIKKARK